MVANMTKLQKVADALSVCKSKILSQAVLTAAKYLGLNDLQLATTIGITNNELAKIEQGEKRLIENSAPYLRAADVIRLYQALFAIVGGDESVMLQWMQSPNLALDATPIEKIRSKEGLQSVINYLVIGRAPI